jgi:hypothetical protein
VISTPNTTIRLLLRSEQSRSSVPLHIKQGRSRRRNINTHPQLPLPLLALQRQPLNRIRQPLFLLPQRLQPKTTNPLAICLSSFLPLPSPTQQRTHLTPISPPPTTTFPVLLPFPFEFLVPDPPLLPPCPNLPSCSSLFATKACSRRSSFAQCDSTRWSRVVIAGRSSEASEACAAAREEEGVNSKCCVEW